MGQERSRSCVAWASLAVAVASITAAASAPSHAAEELFRGKTITMSSSSAPSGGFDIYVRLLARHFGAHLAGSPSVVAQNRPGGGGLVLANYLYNSAPKDGTQIALIPAYVLLDAIFNSPQAKFEPTKFIWIGNMNQEVDHCSVWENSGVTRPEDFFSREVILGASGASAGSFTIPMVMNAELGTKFKVILGYSSSAVRNKAMEQGEIHGQCGTYLSSIKATSMQDVAAGRLRIIWQMGLEKHPDFAQVPLAIDYAKTDEARQMMQMFFASMTLGRSFALPPDTPADRVTALRAAFAATMGSPDFRGEADKLKIELRPMNAPEMQPALDKLLGAPRAVVDKAAVILEAARGYGSKQEEELKAKGIKIAD
jgi:tripartite-type tricarboxylate transporter receptor subunit TctC